MRLLLVRHGQTPGNTAGALDTAYPGFDLTPLGRLQAAAVADVLAGEPIAGVHASRLVRTQQTATPLAAALTTTVEVVDGFEEVSAGDLEMRTDEQAVRTYVETIAAWMHGEVERRMPGGESGREVLDRYLAALGDATSRYDADATVAVFSHGAVIRYVTTALVGLDPGRANDLRLMNTGMAVLDGRPGAAWSLERWVSEPLGGTELGDRTAEDPTGESVTEAVDD